VPSEGADGFAGSTQESTDSAGLMMDTLAVVDHSDGAGLSRSYDVLRGGNEGLLVAFFGDLDEEQAALAARMRQRSGAAVAFVLDSGTWVTSGAVAGAVDDRLRLLREAGWTALSVSPGTPLSDLWQQAGRQRSESSGSGTNGFSGGWS
jgi:hypothetical protein